MKKATIRRWWGTLALLSIASLVSSAPAERPKQPGRLSLDKLRVPYENVRKRRVYVVPDVTGGKRLLDRPPVSAGGRRSPYEVDYQVESYVSVLSGNGRKILDLGSESKIIEWAKGTFTVNSEDHEPDVHPSQDRIVYVRCRAQRYDCQLVESRLDRQAAQVSILYAPERDNELIDSPVWSPDGSRVAFLIGKDIGIMDRGSGTFRRVQLDRKREAAPWSTNLWARDYIRWSADGTRIFIWAERSGAKAPDTIGPAIGELELTSGQIRWLDIQGMTFLY